MTRHFPSPNNMTRHSPSPNNMTRHSPSPSPPRSQVAPGAAMAERNRGQSPHPRKQSGEPLLHSLNGLGSSAVDQMLDTENKRMADNLSSKVSRLKSIALDIDQEAEDQNRYLDGMDTDFSSVTGLLTGSVKRFSTMVKSGRDNKKLLCYMSVGLVLLFFILYYLVTRMQT
uniref:BET1-like protein isoform X2 n=1 Tax=Pristiophorus japonicus TaxID=55135 RepID=UPI00398E8A70